MKTIYIVGVEGKTSGSFDWFADKQAAENFKITQEALFNNLEDEIVYSGSLSVPDTLTDGELTDYIHNWLMENDFENAFKTPENKNV